MKFSIAQIKVSLEETLSEFNNFHGKEVELIVNNFICKLDNSKILIDWTKIPENYHFVAMDQLGGWRAYENEPSAILSEGIWSDSDVDKYLDLSNSVFTFVNVDFDTLDWTDTLQSKDI
ncbi:hypothetical protein ZZ1p0046 [Acinetobacter phage ZZ1]|jgi:hypothetical protein|uniref:Uncharacterized protein n=2 Tax=Caudoviricetes TaxID=2731619 RepID=I3WVR0_9CAUD|nr:hypothetical protein ZZ1p0046 [Acinetobacter phage ZZ1]AFL47580.1 hypothetical protein ZZ1p0046 [Acinetobacter phage ZZ1]